ncbi:MAG: hypothetical protein SGCHY_001732 [Lobulomycetales sp.]
MSFSSVVGSGGNANQSSQDRQAEFRPDDFPALGGPSPSPSGLPQGQVSASAASLDLTALGLNLNAKDSLYTSFASPFAADPVEGSSPTDAFTALLPDCYLQPTSLSPPDNSSSTSSTVMLLSKIPAFQEAAAQELYNRGWRFHKELRLWLTKVSSLPPDSTTSPPPNEKGSGPFERGVYLFFDPSSWSKVKKEWVLYYDQLEERAVSSSRSPPATTAS